jgi:hypothetical protein
MDKVQSLTRDRRQAIYGDAFNIEVMHQALPRATHLVIALPHAQNRNPLIVAAKLIIPRSSCSSARGISPSKPSSFRPARTRRFTRKRRWVKPYAIVSSISGVTA